MTTEAHDWHEPTEIPVLAEILDLPIVALRHHCRKAGIELGEASNDDVPTLTHAMHEFTAATTGSPKVNPAYVSKNIDYYYNHINRAGETDAIRRQKANEYMITMVTIAQNKASQYPEIQQAFLLERALRQPDRSLLPVNKAIHGLLAAYGKRFEAMTGYNEHIGRSMVRPLL